MENVFYFKTRAAMLKGEAGINLLGDIRCILVMENTTIGDEVDAIEFLDDFTTLDEHDGPGYARLNLATATPSVVEDAVRESVILRCATHPTFSSLGAGARNVAGVLFYFHGITDSVSRPWIYAKYTTPRVADGSDFVVELPGNKDVFENIQAPKATAPVTHEA